MSESTSQDYPSLGVVHCCCCAIVYAQHFIHKLFSQSPAVFFSGCVHYEPVNQHFLITSLCIIY
ncbi:hypothetical protein BDF14DRAFT_1802358, partial [Spinellus fusiger]